MRRGFDFGVAFGFGLSSDFSKRSLDDDIYDRGWGGGTSRIGLYDLGFLCG